MKHVYSEDFESKKKLGLVGCGHSGCYSMDVVNSNQEIFEKVIFANFGHLGPFANIKDKIKSNGKGWLLPPINVLLFAFYRASVFPVLGRKF